MAVEIKGKSTKQLAEMRANIVTNARTYLEANESNWGKEQEEQYGAMLADVSTIKSAIDRREAIAGIDASVASAVEAQSIEVAGRGVEQPKLSIRGTRYGSVEQIDAGPRGSASYQKAFSRALGGNQLGPDQMAALRSDKDPEGGYLVASEQFASELLKNVDDYLFIRQLATVVTVREATSLGIRSRSSQAATFGWSSELSVSNEDTALKFGKKALTPNHLTGMIKVSRDFMRRSVMSPDAIVREELAIDAAQVMEDAYMTGNGASKPLGVFTASNDGISTGRDIATDNTTTAITADGLMNAKFALKAQYRMMDPRWMFSRTAIKAISKLKDTTNQYLWQPGLQAGQPDRLLGYTVDESERCPATFTAGLYVGLLAVWRYYWIADALDMELQVLNELYAGSNQIGYIGRLKTDGMPVLEEAFVRVTLAP